MWTKLTKEQEKFLQTYIEILKRTPAQKLKFWKFEQQKVKKKENEYRKTISRH